MTLSPPRGEELTRREREIIAHLMSGLTRNETIASEMVVSRLSVKWHLANVYRKLDVRDRTQLVCYAWRHGIVVDGEWYPSE
jgi:DNA-binding NarL/FixJ family response regulator